MMSTKSARAVTCWGKILGPTRQRVWVAVQLCLIAALALPLFACRGLDARQDVGRSVEAAQDRTPTQVSEGGQVTIKVTWQGLDAGLVFTTVMDTHSVNLDAYDLQLLAVLRIDQETEIRPSGWDAPKGSHHREGTLTFPASADDGSAIISPNTRALELVIHDVAGVPERTFRWER